ncbi:hypothetical protein HOY80DRAFT_950995 [Tuber brumale]|nr:hypothetical protein HOY80DRAFT_950995 [Tuber brumale]
MTFHPLSTSIIPLFPALLPQVFPISSSLSGHWEVYSSCRLSLPRILYFTTIQRLRLKKVETSQPYGVGRVKPTVRTARKVGKKPRTTTTNWGRNWENKSIDMVKKWVRRVLCIYFSNQIQGGAKRSM